MQALKALARLCICADSPEHSLLNLIKDQNFKCWVIDDSLSCSKVNVRYQAFHNPEKWHG